MVGKHDIAYMAMQRFEKPASSGIVLRLSYVRPECLHADVWYSAETDAMQCCPLVSRDMEPEPERSSVGDIVTRARESSACTFAIPDGQASRA